MATFTYPSSAELIEIAQDKMPRLIQDRPIFDIMPISSQDENVLMWEQDDNYQGLQQVRGLDGAPRRVKKTGMNRYSMIPGVYGEYEVIDETEITTRRRAGSFGTPVDISDLVMKVQDKLLLRRLDRIELIGWTLILTGTFSVSSPEGTLMHTDTFPLQSFAASTPWSTWASATPMADLRTIQLKSRGHSVDFGRKAKLFVNRKTANDILSNSNATDLYGRRTGQAAGPALPPGGTLNTIKDVNAVLMDQDLPEIVIYDQGYLSDGTDGNAAGSFQLFIPNGEAVLVGVRPAGQTIAQYRYTRNANMPDAAPGAYMRVIDTADYKVPRTVEVHDGHNGGPVIFFPSGIVKLTGL
jgi:hypothetical protein